MACVFVCGNWVSNDCFLTSSFNIQEEVIGYISEGSLRCNPNPMIYLIKYIFWRIKTKLTERGTLLDVDQHFQPYTPVQVDA